MPEITVTIKPSFAAIGKAIGDANLNTEMHKIIQEFAFAVERYSKQVTPVDTGRLRSSIGTGFLISGGLTMGGTARVAPHTDYAGWVHEGTRRMRGRPFMRHGVQFAEQKFSGQHIASRLDDKLRQSLSRL